MSAIGIPRYVHSLRLYQLKKSKMLELDEFGKPQK